MELQWIVVGLAVAVAAVYAGRVFLRQFRHADDEPAGCANCPALEAIEQAQRRSSTQR